MKKLLFVLLLCFSLPSIANWVVESETNKSTNYYLKKNSYKTFFGDVEVTILGDLKYPDRIYTDRRSSDGSSNQESYSSIVTTYQIDCKKKLQKMLKIKFYSGQMGQGLLVSEIKDKSDWFGLDSSSNSLFCK